MKIECRKCFEKDMTGGELEEIIKDYISSVEPEFRASEPVYQERLSACDKCEALINGLCRYCGCFVLARAAKLKLPCPYPGKDKWLWN